MTATSGPGFSLMQEAIGYAAFTETPGDCGRAEAGGNRKATRSEAAITCRPSGLSWDYQIIALSHGLCRNVRPGDRGLQSGGQYRSPYSSWPKKRRAPQRKDGCQTQAEDCERLKRKGAPPSERRRTTGAAYAAFGRAKTSGHRLDPQ